MHIITIQQLNKQKLVTELRHGKTVVYPTETCYGLGCDATNEQAVEKIFQIKGREASKSVLMIAPDIEMVQQYVVWTPTVQKIADKYWSSVALRSARKPGPLTIVLPLKDNHPSLAQGVIGADNTVAFRVTEYSFVHDMVTVLQRPLVSTSANLAGKENPYDIATVLRMFEERTIKPDIIIDAGVLPQQKPSTIIRIIEDTIIVVRQGDLIVET